MSSEVFKMEIAVGEEHLDELNHVNNVTYLQWVQDVAQAHWNSRSTGSINEAYYWVVIDHFIQYKKPAFLGDVLLATTFIEKHEGVRSTRIVQFEKEGKMIVTASTNWCLVDRRSNKPKRIPSEITELFLNNGHEK